MTFLLTTLVFIIIVMFWDLFTCARLKRDVPLSVQIMYSGFIATLLVLIANA